ncbi:MAG: hypothetical protein ACXVA9_07320 [Bdellovibrionales bacterium]
MAVIWVAANLILPQIPSETSFTDAGIARAFHPFFNWRLFTGENNLTRDLVVRACKDPSLATPFNAFGESFKFEALRYRNKWRLNAIADLFQHGDIQLGQESLRRLSLRYLPMVVNAKCQMAIYWYPANAPGERHLLEGSEIEF